MPDAELANVQPVPSVTVTTFPLTKSFAAGHAPKPLKVTDCPAARVKFGLKTTLMVLEGERAPDAEVVRPTVQAEFAFAAVEPGEKIALTGAEA